MCGIPQSQGQQCFSIKVSPQHANSRTQLNASAPPVVSIPENSVNCISWNLIMYSNFSFRVKIIRTGTTFEIYSERLSLLQCKITTFLRICYRVSNSNLSHGFCEYS